MRWFPLLVTALILSGCISIGGSSTLIVPAGSTVICPDGRTVGPVTGPVSC